MAELDLRRDRSEFPADWEAIADGVRRYLEAGAIVRPGGRPLDPDLIDPFERPRVNTTVFTDGEWVWFGAHRHYLEVHGVPLDPLFVSHIRAHGFEVAQVNADAVPAASRSLRERPQLDPARHGVDLAEYADAAYDAQVENAYRSMLLDLERSIGAGVTLTALRRRTGLTAALRRIGR